MMDCKRGSKRYKQLLAVEFDKEFTYTRHGRQWICEIDGSSITAGVGLTKNDARVDFVEEAELMTVWFGGKPYTRGSGYEAINTRG